MGFRVRIVSRCKDLTFTQYYLSPRYFLVVYSIEKLPRAILATGIVNLVKLSASPSKNQNWDTYQAYDSLGAILFSIRCPL